MSYPVENIINVVTRISPSGLSFANFASATLFVREADAPIGFDPDTRRTYSSLNAVSEDFPSGTEAYAAAQRWFTIPTPPELTIYIRATADADVPTSLDKARNQFYWYWTFFTDEVYADLANFPAVAQWGDDNDSYVINCAVGAATTAIRDPGVSNDIASTLTTQGTRHCTTLAHATDKYAGVSLCAQFAAVNFSAERSTITGEFKKLSGVPAESLTDTEYSAMRQDTKKSCFYTVVDLQGSTDQGRVINSRSHSAFGEFMDDVFNLDGFVNDLKVTLYNALANQVTKLPQAPAGQSVLIGAAKETGERYIANGYLGQRNYTDPDDGIEKTTRGYEILTQPEDILNLSEADRNDRKAAPIRIRIFRAGAVHAVDVTVDVF